MAIVSVVVRTLAGVEHHFHLPQDSSVTTLKHEIEQKTRIPYLCQRLSYGMDVISDDAKKLCDLYEGHAGDSLVISLSVSDALAFEILSKPAHSSANQDRARALEALGDLYENHDNEDVLSVIICNLRQSDTAAMRAILKIASVGNVTAITALTEYIVNSSFLSEDSGYIALCSLMQLADVDLVCEVAVCLRLDSMYFAKRLAAKKFLQEKCSIGAVQRLVVDQFRSRMASSEASVRELAARAFADISEVGCKEVIESLLPYVLDEAAAVRAVVAQSLVLVAGKGQEDVISAMRSAISDSISTSATHPGRCHELIKIIPDVFMDGDQQSIRLLMLCVDHSDFMVSTSARLALRKLREFSTVLFRGATADAAKFEAICHCQGNKPMRSALEKLLNCPA